MLKEVYNKLSLEKFFADLPKPSTTISSEESNLQLFNFLCKVNKDGDNIKEYAEGFYLNIFYYSGQDAEKAFEVYCGIKPLLYSNDNLHYPQHNVYSDLLKWIKS